MKKAPSFLGYSRLSAEVTAEAVDHREQIDLSTEQYVFSEAPLTQITAVVGEYNAFLEERLLYLKKGHYNKAAISLIR